MLKLIINADDFGFSTEVNRAILDAFGQGLCSSTTMMPNMGGFEEACQLVHENNLAGSVGIHLNLGEGFPLVSAMKRQHAFCDSEGRFRLNSTCFPLYLSLEQRRILAEEIRAQIKRCRQRGIPLTHLDSHWHIHTRWAILGVLLPVATEEHIRYIRLPRNCGNGIGPVRRAYKTWISRWITAAKMRGTNYFGSVEDYMFLKHAGAMGVMELMMHPRYGASGLLCDHPRTHALVEEMKNVTSYDSALSFADVVRPVCAA